MLDWTTSPYVAAFFAFINAKKDTKVAIYEYQQSTRGVTFNSGGDPNIIKMGPYVETHKRHYLQQSQYTVCVKDSGGERDRFIYQSHEKVKFGDSIAEDMFQNIVSKYIIPSSDREKALYDLRLMNINSFSLFGDEESLMTHLAEKEFFEERWIHDPKPVDKSAKSLEK